MVTTPIENGSDGDDGGVPKAPHGLVDTVVALSREVILATLGIITWKAVMIRAGTAIVLSIVRWVGSKLLFRGEIKQVNDPDQDRRYSIAELEIIRRWLNLIRRDDQAIESTGSIAAAVTEDSPDAFSDDPPAGQSEEGSQIDDGDSTTCDSSPEPQVC